MKLIYLVVKYHIQYHLLVMLVYHKYIFFALELLIIISIFIFGIKWFLKTDTPVYWANEIYPLDTNHIYIIRKNDAVLAEGVLIFEAEMFYALSLVSENSPPLPDTSGRLVGSTDIELESFVNKPVYIQGYFYEGYPYQLKHDGQFPSNFLSEKRAVLHISSLKVVK